MIGGFQQFLTKNGMTSMPQPPYSPDRALSDFFFVSLGEKSPQRETFTNVAEEGVKQK